MKWVMACEAEVVRDLIPRLRGIDVPKLCGDAYRHCFKRGRESTETIQDSIAAEEREAATRVREYYLSCSATFLCRIFFLVLLTLSCSMQAQSVMSAKDRYLQRKAGSSSAAASAVKKEKNCSQSTATEVIDAASSSSILVKKEPEVQPRSSGVAIKRE